MNYADHLNPNRTPQSEPIPGTAQTKNSAGGFSWAVDDWTRLDRFLILGSEGGSYYATERKLTIENAAAVKRCIAADGARVVERIVAISDAGRAPKNDPAILALALCAKTGNEATRRAANAALPHVCRIGTHLLHYAEYLQLFGGWGRGVRNAVARWFDQKAAKDVVYQAVKYQSRDGWAMRDLLRLSHPKAPTKEHAAIYNWIVKGTGPGEEWNNGSPVQLAWAFERAKVADAVEIVKLIEEYRLPRECVPTQHLNDPRVWAALLPHMKPEALIRNLGKMTAVGLLKPLSQDVATVCAKLEDVEALKRSRLHPIKVLAALLTYHGGHGIKGSLSWSPVQNIVDALDAAFYKTFQAIEPTGKRTMLALDVSGSMGMSTCAGVPGLTPRVGSAAMALVTAATEKSHIFVAFTNTGSRMSMHHGYAAGISPITISPRQRLGDVVQAISHIPFGGTDCALPMLYAQADKLEVDTFCVYTDSETWAGNIHPSQALREYRQKTGIGAKLIVVGMVANEFTIADPNDAGMMDVVGFDTAAPSIMADFSRV
jgi:60 kDa SS-A/Ro ribonucleoprotein